MNLVHLLVLFPDSLSKSVDLKPWKQIKRMVWRQIDKKQRDPICRSGCAYITLRHGSSKEPAYRRLERCVGGVGEDFHLTDSFLLRPRVQSDGEEREREERKWLNPHRPESPPGKVPERHLFRTGSTSGPRRCEMTRFIELPRTVGYVRL